MEVLGMNDDEKRKIYDEMTTVLRNEVIAETSRFNKYLNDDSFKNAFTHFIKIVVIKIIAMDMIEQMMNECPESFYREFFADIEKTIRDSMKSGYISVKNG
jgi:hypothetical protein